MKIDVTYMIVFNRIVIVEDGEDFTRVIRTPSDLVDWCNAQFPSWVDKEHPWFDCYRNILNVPSAEDRRNIYSISPPLGKFRAELGATADQVRHFRATWPDWFIEAIPQPCHMNCLEGKDLPLDILADDGLD